VRRLRAELAGGALSTDDRTTAENLIRTVRAQVMQVPAGQVEQLDAVGDYARRPAGDENQRLCELLDGPAGRSDFGRAEVALAFLRRYVALAQLSATKRRPYAGTVNPREVLRRLLKEPIGPELSAVLDEHVHLLLYDDWVSHIDGVQKLTTSFVRGSDLSCGTYETLRDVYIETVRGKRASRVGPRMADGDGEPRTPTTRFALRRDDPRSWPALNDYYLLPLWEAAVAQPQDRQLIFDALVDAILQPVPNTDSYLAAWERLPMLLLPDVVPDDMVRAALDRLLPQLGQLNEFQRTSVLLGFEPVLCQAPSKRPQTMIASRWKEILEWWNRSGRTAGWRQPLQQPVKAVACVVFAPAGDATRATLLTAEVTIEPGRAARAVRQTPYGTLEFKARAWRLKDDKQTLFLRAGCALLPGEESDEPLDTGALPEPLGDPVPNGLHVHVAELFASNPGGPTHQALVVILTDRPELLDVPKQPDLDWAFDQFCKRFPPGEIIPCDGGFPGGQDAFIPHKYRVMIAEHYFDGLGSPPPDTSSPVETAAHIALFAARGGGTKAVEYLRRWVREKWRYWERVQPLLAECEGLSKAAAAAADGLPGQVEAVRDPQTRAAALRRLTEPERLGRMSEKERAELARQIVLQVLAQEKDPGQRAVLDQALRKLTGKSFGYDPFAPADKQDAAVRDWVEWARQP
jgi:hypothetical protein